MDHFRSLPGSGLRRRAAVRAGALLGFERCEQAGRTDWKPGEVDKWRPDMNWKLILALSLFGLAMGVGSLFGLGLAEPLLWLAIFIIYAWVIAGRAPGKY